MPDICRFRLEILPWVSDVFRDEEPGQVVLEEAVENGTTIGDLIRKLSSDNQAFGDAFFDTNTGKPSGLVMIVLNDRIIEVSKGLDTQIKDGDVVKLLPVISGG